MRRDGVELAGLWASLRREVEDRPASLKVLVRVRRECLDMFGRICAAHLTGPLAGAIGEWTEVPLFGREVNRHAIPAARRPLTIK